MHVDRWREVVGQVKENFAVEEHRPWGPGRNEGEETEMIVFSGPLGRIKLEFFCRPKVLDKKTTYSNRIGSETQVEYIFSPTEKTSQLLAYRWSDADENWLPLDGAQLGF